MFDLTSHIRSWRENLAAEGVYSPSDLDELESHLREAVAALTKQDLSEQEALAVACLRLGDSKGLSQEFAKANAGMIFRRRLVWMCAGLLSYTLISHLAKIISEVGILVGALTGLRGYALGILAQSIHFAAIVLSVLGMVWLVRRYTTINFPMRLHIKRSKVALFVGLAVVSLIPLIGSYLSRLIAARILTPSDFISVAMVGAIVNLILLIIGTLFLIGLVLKMSEFFATNPRSR